MILQRCDSPTIFRGLTYSRWNSSTPWGFLLRSFWISDVWPIFWVPQPLYESCVSGIEEILEVSAISHPQDLVKSWWWELLRESSTRYSQQNLAIYLGLLGLSSFLPSNRIEAIKWWPPRCPDDCSAPLFTKVSTTYVQSWNDTTLGLGCPNTTCTNGHLCLNMVFVLDNLWLLQKSSYKTILEFRSVGAFLTITPPPNNTFTAHVKSPIGAPSSTKYKNAGFSLILYGYYAKTTLRDLFPVRWPREVTPSFTWENSNIWWLSWGAVANSHQLASSHHGQFQSRRVQPLSRSWVLQPRLCMLTSLTITSRYRSTSHISSISPQWDDIPCPHGQIHWPGIELSGPHRGPSPKSHRMVPSKPYSGWWACGKVGPHHSFGLRHPATRRSPVRPDPRPGCRMGPGDASHCNMNSLWVLFSIWSFSFALTLVCHPGATEGQQHYSQET